MTTKSLTGYRLLHEGAVALSQVEANGIRIDTARLEDTLKETAARIKDKTNELRATDVWATWRKRYGTASNLGSRVQLVEVLKLKGHTFKGVSAKGNVVADEATLTALNDPFVKTYLQLEKLNKLNGTYLEGLRRETVGGFLHPFFNLHTTMTYRSSSESPNFQNIPVRDPKIGKVIRSLFVPRKGRRLVEIDYSGIEVRAAAFYHKDPTMLRYIHDPSTDMHRDMAAELYMIDPATVEKAAMKQARHGAKNMFVFPEFYGSYYVDCAKDLWNWIDQAGLTGPGGVPMKKHLKAKGIKSCGECKHGQSPLPGTFEAHVQKVEDNFWKKRFPVYAKWKKTWFEKYQARGYFDTLTGFRISGVYKRNEVINYPVQGVAFHCLLWSLVKLQKAIKKRGMKTLIVGQIHDSIIADVPDDELQDYLTLAKDVMTRRLKKEWAWINTPIDVEVDVTPVDGSWFEKAPWVEKDDGAWVPAA